VWKYIAGILEGLSVHAAGVCIGGGLLFVFLGLFNIADFKSVALRPMAARLPVGLGAGVLTIGILLHIFETRGKKSPNDFSDFYEARAADVSPPNLLFLALAEYFTFPATHGERVAGLNSNWRHDQGEWDRRAAKMGTSGLLNRNSSGEVVRSHLGTAFVFLALKDQRFAEAARIVRSDREMSTQWGLTADG
jgi:hypothetical protein